MSSTQARKKILAKYIPVMLIQNGIIHKNIHKIDHKCLFGDGVYFPSLPNMNSCDFDLQSQ
jgi:hypothetical protein